MLDSDDPQHSVFVSAVDGDHRKVVLLDCVEQVLIDRDVQVQHHNLGNWNHVFLNTLPPQVESILQQLYFFGRIPELFAFVELQQGLQVFF